MTAALKTCLIIDNDADFAAFLQRVAESIGFATRVLTDPTRLEDALSVDRPNVITLDMDMPGRHGLDVLKALSAHGLCDRVIIISGTPPRGAPDDLKVGGCVVAAILAKPARKLAIETALLNAVKTS